MPFGTGHTITPQSHDDDWKLVQGEPIVVTDLVRGINEGELALLLNEIANRFLGNPYQYGRRVGNLLAVEQHLSTETTTVRLLLGVLAGLGDSETRNSAAIATVRDITGQLEGGVYALHVVP